MKSTTNLNLNLPEGSDPYSVDDYNENFETLDTYLANMETSHDEEIADLKESVSDGKALVAAAVTAKKVATAATDTFATIAANIAAIVLGSGNATASDVLAGKTFTNDTGIEQTGTLKDNSDKTLTATASLDTSNSYLVMTVPEEAKYSTGSKLRAAYATIRNLIGLTAAKIAAGNTVLGLSGTYNGIGDAESSDVLIGKSFSTASLSGAEGTMSDYSGMSKEAAPSLDTTNSRLQMTVPALGRYSTSSKLYAAYSTIRDLIGLTAAKLATGESVLGVTGTYKGKGTATPARVLSGYTFSSASYSEADGTMTDNSGTSKSASASLDTTNSRLQMTIPSSGYYTTSSKLYTAYSTIRDLIGLTAAKIATGNTILGITGSYKGLGDATAANVLSGKTFSSASLSNATGTMTNNGAKTASLDPGGSYTIPTGYHNGSGKVTAKTKYITRLHALAYRGFNLASSSYKTSGSDEYTMPAAGTVYYEGISASYSGSGTAICEIYKNGSVVDGRNIDDSTTYIVRSTMVGKSFSAAKGDVIKVSCTATAGSHTITFLAATIEYFQ